MFAALHLIIYGAFKKKRVNKERRKESESIKRRELLKQLSGDFVSASKSPSWTGVTDFNACVRWKERKAIGVV